MSRRLRPQLTYANVVSTLCLFILLGGVAYAATALPKNSVGPKRLRKSAVTEAKLAAGSVNGEKVANGSLTGADINTASLGRVPSATVATSAMGANTALRAATADNAGNADNAAALQGRPASSFLGSGATAANASKLGGRPADAFGSVMMASTPERTMVDGFETFFVPSSGYGIGTALTDVEQVLPGQPFVARDIEVRLEGPESTSEASVWLLVDGVFEEVCEVSGIPASCSPDLTFNLPAGSSTGWEVNVFGGAATLRAELSLRLTPG